MISSIRKNTVSMASKIAILWVFERPMVVGAEVLCGLEGAQHSFRVMEDGEEKDSKEGNAR